MEYYLATTKYWYTQQQKWISKIFWAKEAKYKIVHTILFHLNYMVWYVSILNIRIGKTKMQAQKELKWSPGINSLVMRYKRNLGGMEMYTWDIFVIIPWTMHLKLLTIICQLYMKVYLNGRAKWNFGTIKFYEIMELLDEY